MKDNKLKYITNRWPLIERKMTRHDCENWLKANNLDIPPKSACIFCPFRNMPAWQELKSQEPDSYIKAIAVDDAIRMARLPHQLYLHPSRKPLESIDLRTPQEQGQLELWANWDEECNGVCGV
jgi:hypothetical protein